MKVITLEYLKIAAVVLVPGYVILIIWKRNYF